MLFCNVLGNRGTQTCLELQTCTNKCSFPKNCTKRVKRTHIDKTRAICQNVRNLAKRAEIPVSIVGGTNSWSFVVQPPVQKECNQRVQFCANRRNLEQPSAISKSVRFCFSQREMAQPSQPTLKRAPFFETRANLPNEQKLIKCAHFQTHGNLCSFDVLWKISDRAVRWTPPKIWNLGAVAQKVMVAPRGGDKGPRTWPSSFQGQPFEPNHGIWATWFAIKNAANPNQDARISHLKHFPRNEAGYWLMHLPGPLKKHKQPRV